MHINRIVPFPNQSFLIPRIPISEDGYHLIYPSNSKQVVSEYQMMLCTSFSCCWMHIDEFTINLIFVLKYIFTLLPRHIKD